MKFDRAIADQFAIDFHRHAFLAGDAQRGGLEVFHLGGSDLRTEDHVLQVADDLEVVEALENQDVEKAIIDDRLFEERESGPP